MRKVIANDSTGYWEVHEHGYCVAEFDSESEAMLCAAAPELLAELQHTARNLRSMVHMLPINANAVERESLVSWLARTENAIAKAEGK